MDKIFVTKTFLPPMAEYYKYVEKIWESQQLTNQGPLLKEFESKSAVYLGVKNFHFVQNGTLALQVAIKALGITEGEIITTPFSYVATTSAILWERCTPVFVDINQDDFCIDTNKIEQAITKNTKAILAVHVYGYPCDVEAIEVIAKKYSLKVIYDGAHAFGAQYKGKSLLNYGDISMCSFHATKLFHTIEGGALIVKDDSISKQVDLIKRFGHNGDNHLRLGINAKANEFQAAMGLSNLPHLDKIISGRKVIAERYDSNLRDSGVSIPKAGSRVGHNYSYYPVVFKTEKELLATKDELERNNVFSRRYFYPSLNNLPYLDSKTTCSISEDLSLRVLCLPLYYGLELETVDLICGVITT